MRDLADLLLSQLRQYFFFALARATDDDNRRVDQFGTIRFLGNLSGDIFPMTMDG
ncbi:hypothetical protein [Pelagibacterium luteolum]|uniref:hypothetical protein n=1 Tax=Pelagibacterium luteolum TaxID=440168 RepID=UPI0015A0BCEC|nr:hypothetical protein [Pelagibacterium luteolum]